MANRAPPRFKQIDLTRAARGVGAAGLKVTRVYVNPDGQIVVDVGDAGDLSPVSVLEEWKAKRNAG